MAGAWRAAGWLAICLLWPGLGLAGVTQHTAHTLIKLTLPLTSNEVNLGVCSQNSHPPSSLIPVFARLGPPSAATVRCRQNTHMSHPPTPLSVRLSVCLPVCLSCDRHGETRRDTERHGETGRRKVKQRDSCLKIHEGRRDNWPQDLCQEVTRRMSQWLLPLDE